MNIFLFLSFSFLFTFLLGRLLEKIRVPWLFAPLLLGAALALSNPFSSITNSGEFIFLAEFGMYLLLFMVGFEINIKDLQKISNFVFRSTFFIIFLEALFGGIFVHFIFSYSWFISFLVSLSFATVGEAILIPILDEFKLLKTKLGQSIIAIGSLDDIIEIFILIVISFMINSGQSSWSGMSLTIGSLVLLFIITFVLFKMKKESHRFALLPVDVLLPLSLFVLLLFIGLGEYAQATALAAFLAGLGLRNLIPKEKINIFEKEIKGICYGFFAPLFFLWVGLSLNISYLIKYPLIILGVVIISNAAKIISSWLVGKKELGSQQSILLGIGLSVRFSTSIIIIKILYDSGFIGEELYSVVIASSIIFQFIIPVTFSRLLVKWEINPNNQT